MKHALICGISGQDGAYFTDLVIGKGYEITGTSRDANINPFEGLRVLGVRDRVKLVSITLHDFRSVLQVLDRTRPDEIYNLAGQSSPALSFEQPIEMFDSISVGTLNLLEAIRFAARPVRLYNAGSCNSLEPRTLIGEYADIRAVVRAHPFYLARTFSRKRAW